MSNGCSLLNTYSTGMHMIIIQSQGFLITRNGLKDFSPLEFSNHQKFQTTRSGSTNLPTTNHSDKSWLVDDSLGTNPTKIGNDHDQPGNPVMDSQLRFLGFFQRRENFHGFFVHFTRIFHHFFWSHFRKPTGFVEYWVYQDWNDQQNSEEMGAQTGLPPAMQFIAGDLYGCFLWFL